MRKLALVALTALAIGVSGCKKPVENPPAPGTPNPKTKLQLVVADANNQAIEGASVELYKTQADFDERKQSARVQGILYTGVDGRCTISSLEPIKYWFYVEDKEKVRNNLTDVTSITLPKDVTTIQQVTLK